MSFEHLDLPSSEKEALRARFIRYRQSLSNDEYEQLSAAIVERAADLEELRHARKIHVYWPTIARREIDTRPLIASLESRNAEIILPVVLNFDRTAEPAMAHVRFPGAEYLRRNRWGIAEPELERPVDVDDLDAVIVPALGAGRDGHRIGHGRGYYDAFLATVGAPKICLVYENCVVENLPREDHDVPMDLVVTEHGLAYPTDV